MVVGQVQLQQIGALVQELELLTDDVIARKHQDFKFLGGDDFLIQENVLVGLLLLLLDVQSTRRPHLPAYTLLILWWVSYNNFIKHSAMSQFPHLLNLFQQFIGLELLF